MEFDILNDVLYSTVANLFPNKEAHLKHFIKIEEPYKSEIPRSSKKVEFKEINPIIESKDTKEFNQNLYENWKQKESKKRLEEAIKRLNLDENKAKVKHLSGLSVEFLISEKGKVKNELKKYDNEFTDLFFRTPNRVEKEIMRPVYLYYKNLKSTLDYKNKINPPGKESSVDKNNVNNNPGNVNKSQNICNYINDNNSNANVNTNANVKIGNSSNNNNNQKKNISNNPSNQIINQQININNTHQNQNFNYSNQKAQNEKEQNQSKINTSENFYNNNNNNNNVFNNNFIGNSTNFNKHNNSFNNQKDLDKKIDSNMQKKKIENDQELDLVLLGTDINQGQKRSKSQANKERKFTKNDLIAMERELDLIKKDQVDLKQKLHNYQKEFYQQHNRKVKYYKDIIGMEIEYQSYKENKMRIKQILDILEGYKFQKEN